MILCCLGFQSRPLRPAYSHALTPRRLLYTMGNEKPYGPLVPQSTDGTQPPIVRRSVSVRRHRQGGLPSGLPAAEGTFRGVGGRSQGAPPIQRGADHRPCLWTWTAGANPPAAGRHFPGSLGRGPKPSKKCCDLACRAESSLAAPARQGPFPGDRPAGLAVGAAGCCSLGARLRWADRLDPGKGGGGRGPRGCSALLPRPRSCRSRGAGGLDGWSAGHGCRSCGPPTL